MKVQCDVCGKEEASVFCCADEAALCAACDGRVHRANKLAGKHRRLSLVPPSSHSAPLCDICQERRGFVFCQEDRAILCRDCDAPIHDANELTKKHSRYLLTGVRLSSDSAPTSSAVDDAVSPEDQTDVHTAAASAGTSAAARTTTTTNTLSNSSSSISDYLIKMLPGWHVEDLLVDDAAAAAASASSCSVDGFFQNDVLQQYLESDDLSMLAAAEFPLWAPQVPQATMHYAVPSAVTGGGAGVNYSSSFRQKELNQYYQQQQQQQQLGVKVSRDWWSDDSFTVPQISPPAAATSTRNNKRPRYSAAAEWCF